jgi:hypothetical protein
MAEYRSGRALAKALGISPAAITGYLRRPDWPLARRPPWSGPDLDVLRRWRTWLQEDRSGKGEDPADEAVKFGPNARQKADVLLKLHRARKLRAEADLAEGKVIERELHELAMVALARLFTSAAEDTFERLPHQLSGDRTANAAICRSAGHELRERILGQAELELIRIDDEIHARLMRKRRPRGRRAP